MKTISAKCLIKRKFYQLIPPYFQIFEKLKYPADKNPASLIVKILDLNPKKRLNGRRLLFDEFFDELFQPGKIRKGGGLVTDAISLEEQKLVL